MVDMDKVIEAGARAIWTKYTYSAIPPGDLRGITWEELKRWAAQRPKIQEVVDLCYDEARACLTAALAEARAQGAVMAVVPERVKITEYPEALRPWAAGYNAAIAAMRAGELEAENARMREALVRIANGDHPEGASLAVNGNYRELEARLRAIARAAIAAMRAGEVRL